MIGLKGNLDIFVLIPSGLLCLRFKSLSKRPLFMQKKQYASKARKGAFRPANRECLLLPTGVSCTGPVAPGLVLVTVVIVVVVVVVVPLGSTAEPATRRSPLYVSLLFTVCFLLRDFSRRSFQYNLTVE